MFKMVFDYFISGVYYLFYGAFCLAVTLGIGSVMLIVADEVASKLGLKDKFKTGFAFYTILFVMVILFVVVLICFGYFMANLLK